MRERERERERDLERFLKIDYYLDRFLLCYVWQIVPAQKLLSFIFSAMFVVSVVVVVLHC